MSMDVIVGVGKGPLSTDPSAVGVGTAGFRGTIDVPISRAVAAGKREMRVPEIDKAGPPGMSV